MLSRWLIVALVGLSLTLLWWHPHGSLVWAVAALSVCVGAYVWHFHQKVAVVEYVQTRELDTTRAKVDELERQNEEERTAFEALAEGIDLCILVCGLDTTVYYANEAARNLFNFKDPENRTFLALTLSYDLHYFLSEAVSHPGLHRKEFSLQFPSEMTVIISVWPKFKTSGEPDFFYITLQDVTQLRKLEQVRRDFVANVSHELRTPLSSIRAMAETIIDDPDLDPALSQKWLNNIIRETERLTRIADDLLVLTRAESQTAQKALMDMVDVIEEVVGRLSPRAKEMNLQIEVSLNYSLPIIGNYDQMQQVIWNLVDNAIKYTPEGSVKICGSAENDEVVISVADTGIGILSEHLTRIFERFYRADKARSRATGGTGLGLSIVKHIVEAHDGTVEVDSEYRRGSTFTIRLPKAALDEQGH